MALIVNRPGVGKVILQSGDSPGYYDEGGKYHPTTAEVLAKNHKRELEQRRKQF